MQSIITFFITLASFATIALFAIIGTSIAVVFATLLLMVSLLRFVSIKLKSQPIPAKTTQQEKMRVWNDGKGTIIDL